jgi:Ca2+-binding RTX toxin-like protein
MPYIGTSGNDILEGVTFQAYIWYYMGDGDDTVKWPDVTNAPYSVYIDGGRGNDTLYGNAQGDEIYGGTGDDKIYAFGGDDIIDGGYGNDFLIGHDGDDIISGGFGNDTIVGGDGANRIDGGEGVDTIYIGKNFYNQVYGGGGFDTLIYDDAYASSDTQRVYVDLLYQVFRDGAEGNLLDSIGGTIYNDQIGGDHSRNELKGNYGNDAIAGRGGNDFIQGDGGSDKLYGQDGDDVLYGDNPDIAYINGNDLLVGGVGSDLLVGGLGADRFYYETINDSGVTPATCDYITDLTQAQGDKIDVSLIDANTLIAGNQAFVLDAGGAFSAGEIRQTILNGELYLTFNVDGDAAAEMMIRLAGRTAVTAADFTL